MLYIMSTENANADYSTQIRMMLKKFSNEDNLIFYVRISFTVCEYIWAINCRRIMN